jgi:AraC-like DNA-binding protein
MLFEPTTLAATATAIAEAIQSLGGDPKRAFQRAGLDMDEMQKPGARYPFRAMIRLWNEARVEGADPCIGLFAAKKLKPHAMHALGLAWLSSSTLATGLQRMVRYARIANTSLRFRLENEAEQVKLVAEFHAHGLTPAPEATEAVLAVIVKMCRLMTDSSFAPLLVTFTHEDNGHMEQYVDTFQAPVLWAKSENALYFDAQVLAQPVPAGNEELAAETSRIAERYLATLDPERVQDRVRKILLTLLPSGEVDQEAVAKTLHRSVSSLQRQLRAEGASYRQILDETRVTLAQQFVREKRYSLGQIAYLLGFSDQANFSRAFKRWTGHTPTEFRAS